MDFIYENNICNIYIDHVNQIEDGYKKCISIMKQFIRNKEIYFMVYRDDGININDLDMTKEEVDKYIIGNGSIITYINSYSYCGYLLNKDKTWVVLPSISKWYLDSSFFDLNKSIDQFKDFYMDNHMERYAKYIKSGFASIIFSFLDSGDFCVSFDADKHSVESIKESLKKEGLL